MMDRDINKDKRKETENVRERRGNVAIIRTLILLFYLDWKKKSICDAK